VQDGLERPVARGVAHFLRDGKVVPLAWDEDVWQGAKGRLADTLVAIDAEDYPARTRYCARCSEFQAICPHSVVEPKAEGEIDEVV
jgi:hypothetical protein